MDKQTKENKTRVVRIFTLLKIIELGVLGFYGYFIIPFGKYIERLFGGPMCNEVMESCHFSIYLIIGFLYSIGILILLILIIFLVGYLLIVFIETNWKWAKNINKELFTTKK